MRRFTHIWKTAASVFLGLSLIFSSMVVGIRHEHQVSVSDVHLHKDHSHGDHSHSDHSHGEHATHCGPQHGHQHLHFAGRAVAGDHHRNERDGSIAIFETSETSINAHQSSHWSVVTFQIPSSLSHATRVVASSLKRQRNYDWIATLFSIERPAPPVPPPRSVC